MSQKQYQTLTEPLFLKKVGAQIGEVGAQLNHVGAQMKEKGANF